MTKKFMEKVIKEGVVDTNKYRYVVRDVYQHTEIVRLPLECLDTTAALDGWEVVATVK